MSIKIYNEQLLIIAAFSLIMAMGIDWGLPNEKRNELLIGDTPPTQRQLSLLTSFRQEYLQQKENALNQLAEKLLKGEKKGLRWPLGPRKIFGEVESEEDRLIAFRAFILGSSATDERKVYSMLSRMNPRTLDFDPKKYQYGGTYVYPIGGALFFLKTLGVFELTKDLGYYLKHPSNIAIMYITGRGLNVLAFVGTLILLALFGKMLGGRIAGTLAMLTYSFSTLVLTCCLWTKPHLYAGFWVFLGLFLLYLYGRDRKTKFLVFSVLATGWAFGSSVTTGMIAIAYPIFLFDKHRVRQTLVQILLAWGGMGAIFILTNPYAILRFDRYLLTLVSMGSGEGLGFGVFSLSKILFFLRDLLFDSYTFPVAILGFLYMFVACLKSDKFTKRFAILSLFIFFSGGAFYPRAKVFLYMGPILCLFSGLAINQWFLRSLRFNRVLKVVAVILIFLPGAFFATLFVRDYIDDSNWYEPTVEWIRSAHIGHETNIGVFERPGPTKFPPFPFLNAQLVNMNMVSKRDSLPDYVIIRGGLDAKEMWDRHKVRPQYHMAYDLGNRPSYRWFLNFRTISKSSIAGWVYKRNRANL